MVDFSGVPTSFVLLDEKGRAKRFPTRRDYLSFLIQSSVVPNEAGFVANDELVTAVYLDWIKRGQVGCVFAQLLTRPKHRHILTTVVARERATTSDPHDLALRLAAAVAAGVADEKCEGLTVLFPTVLTPDALVSLVIEVSKLPGWSIERDWPWRGTLSLVGLRVDIAEKVKAETLGLGPYPFFPATRQCPVTSLEIRTKIDRSKYSKTDPGILAAHLADLPIDMSPGRFGKMFREWTPALKRRILRGEPDERAKASVTYSLPLALWTGLKGSHS